jgi:hypothetical protein
MTPEEYRQACASLGLSPTYSAAVAIGISRKTAGGYNRGEPIPMTVVLLLQALVELQELRERLALLETRAAE